MLSADDYGFMIYAGTKQWIFGSILQGNRCLDAMKKMSEISQDMKKNQLLSDQLRIEEQFFLNALGNLVRYISELQKIDATNNNIYIAFLNSIPNAKLIRDMREHLIGIESYFKGDARKQSDFIHGIKDDKGNTIATVDGSSTVRFSDEEYLIGGRVNVSETIRFCEAFQNQYNTIFDDYLSSLA